MNKGEFTDKDLSELVEEQTNPHFEGGLTFDVNVQQTIRINAQNETDAIELAKCLFSIEMATISINGNEPKEAS